MYLEEQRDILLVSLHFGSYLYISYFYSLMSLCEVKNSKKKKENTYFSQYVLIFFAYF